MKFPSSSVLAFVFLTACATLAEAHAYLDHADPKVGSAVPSSPTEVKIWFTSPLIPGRSTLEVVDAKAQEVDKKGRRGRPEGSDGDDRFAAQTDARHL